MWPRRLKQWIALLPLTLLVTCDAPGSEHRAPEQRPPAARAERLAPRPFILGRREWHADEKAVREKPVYTGPVEVIFVHHTTHSDTYDCKRDVPEMLRSMEEHHIHDMGWNDLGYNFVVDRCGNIYEGRAGGVDRAVRGAHTKGFNVRSAGIAALGSFENGAKAPRPMLKAIAAIAAWKLSARVNPEGRAKLTSTSDKSKYRKGTSVELYAISGHRDGYDTDCPGATLYAALPWIRKTAEQMREKAAH